MQERGQRGQEQIILKRVDDEASINIPQIIKRYSPTGMEWGYGGSGPADLALNILILYTDIDTANRLHQDFKWEFIATMPKEGGIIKRKDIIDWIKRKRKKERNESNRHGKKN